MTFCCCTRTPRIESAKLCHGTHFASLYFMVKYDQSRMLPFDQLKRPPFAGELRRGIRDGGSHRSATSWASVEVSYIAIDYAKRYPFKLSEIEERLQWILEGDEKCTNGDLAFLGPPHASERADGIYWNRTRVLIRQLRAWDEKLFQEKYLPGLKKWLKNLYAFWNSERPLCSPLQIEQMRIKAKLIEQDLSAPPSFVLEREAKRHILEGPPIVFLTHRFPTDVVSSDCLIDREMHLGKDIPWIATTDISYVVDFLKQYGLAKKVSVISIETLKRFSRS